MCGSNKTAIAPNAAYLDFVGLQGGNLLASVLLVWDMISAIAKASPQVREVSHSPPLIMQCTTALLILPPCPPSLSFESDCHRPR
ncbi:uncharacterized protein ARMOST_02020 [Armillaria ostoyae]|uniref:Uncharacterized protein n=1 Tax=Armillaria ostoyae TaxID=47428 RepID=A0A284QQS9_ARMOS|nr:uncharacterized protein ARMOST_02020 [Armillaria ostoyae]